MKYLFTLLFITVTILPQVALAQEGDGAYELEEIVVDTEPSGFVTCVGPDCTFCDIVDMAQSIMTFLLQIATVISVIIIAVAGIRLVVSRGNSSALGEAKKQLLNIMIGIAIVMFAFTIVDVFLKVLIGGDFGVWNEIDSDKCGGENLVGTAEDEFTVGGHDVDTLYDMKSDPEVGYTAGPDDGLRGGAPKTGDLVEYAGYKYDSGIVSNVEYVAKTFGLRVTSGYRTAERNAAVGGVPTSYHLLGRAVDYVGSADKMREAEAWAKSHGAVETLIHNAGSGTHLHIAW